MFDSTAPVLFESTDAVEVLGDPANEVWLAVVAAVFLADGGTDL